MYGFNGRFYKSFRVVSKRIAQQTGVLRTRQLGFDKSLRMESGHRPEYQQNTRAPESEEPRYERRRSVSGPEHQYSAPGTPMHQCTNTPSTPITNSAPGHQYTKFINCTKTNTPIAVYRASAQCAKYTKTKFPIHQNQYQYTNTPTPVPIHKHQYVHSAPGWSSVGDFYQGRTVFITGATGFMGKVDGSRST